ncbi:MAG: hypothetical protein C0594_15610, partial [Marinilabiliales bacterium]
MRRRKFIKISSLGLGSVAVSGSILNWALASSETDDTLYREEGLERYPTYCEVCFWKCAGWTYKD